MGTELGQRVEAANIKRARLVKGVPAIDIFVEVGLCKSKGEATKIFQSGNAWVGERMLNGSTDTIDLWDFIEPQAILRVGKIRRRVLTLVN